MLVTRRKSIHATSLYLGNTILEQVETFRSIAIIWPKLDTSRWEYLLQSEETCWALPQTVL